MDSLSVQYSYCSGRKVNGKLNFDVVSDFVVARSLQNSGSVSPGTVAPAPAVNIAVKAEQPDS